MKKIATTIITFCLFIFFYLGQIGCANIIPPSGGVNDTLPPRLVSALPKDSSTNSYTKKIVLTFNEYVEAKDVFPNLVISPLPKNNPIVEHKLKTVTIKLKDSLEPNTTYSFNFGNSIQDVNEGNPAVNFTYVFSTGNIIDNNKLSGKIQLAENGKIDSTLIAVLYKNLADTAVLKQTPRYYAKLKGDGTFTFTNLPQGVFSIYAMPNDYSKKYDDSTKLFAFSDTLITINNNTKNVMLYAYQEAVRKVATPIASTQNTNTAEKDKRLKYSTNLENGRQDILTNKLQIDFNRKIKSYDLLKILLTDTNYKKIQGYTITLDSTKTKLVINNIWNANENYLLLLQKDGITDTTNTSLAKTDTIKFTTKRKEDYGAVKIRFNNLDITKNPVLQIVKDNNIIESIKIKQRDFSRELFNPGEYELRILFDKNNNGIWDTGNYKRKLQPEIVRQLDRKLSVRSNWDNEIDIEL